ncbi:MAG: Nitrogen fixation protein VnfA [Phycisphaerae bacterium]|nr:Nitrogen fixation protein VnfA [Phycisphaerae bacterium]
MPPEALAALLEASAAINSSLDVTDVLNQVARSAAAVARGEAASVMLLDRAQNKLVFRGACGDRGDVLMGEQFDAGLGIAGYVAQTGKSVLAPDAHGDPHWFSGIEDKLSYRTRDLIAAPMIYQGRIIGVIEVLNKVDELPFVESDLSLLQVFANLAAIGTINAQKFEGLIRENQSLRDVQAADHQQLIGNSKPMDEVRDLCRRVAGSTATVLLNGPTGTGKELAARCIHMHSPRRERPFVAVNCAALPETLLESELFGHEKGSFTGADARRIGRFELAAGGTLFLDEVGELSLATQVKLLRVLQEREFVRVGGTETLISDARIIAATNRDLQEAIAQGRFREDLFYRLNVFPIRMPPLRERPEDIPTLVDHFIRRTSRELKVPMPTMGSEAMALLCRYDWPGNVREMQNVIERAALLSGGGEITPALLPREVNGDGQAPAAETGPSGRSSTSLWDYERAMIVQALEKAGWNQSRAARDLGISRDNLRYRVKKYEIRRPPRQK